MQGASSDAPQRPGFGAFLAAPSLTSPNAIYEAFVVRGSVAQRDVASWLGARTGSLIGLAVAACLVVSPGSAAERTAVLVGAGAAIGASQLLTRHAFTLRAQDGILAVGLALLAYIGVTGGPLQPALPAIYLAIGTTFFVVRALQHSLINLALMGVSYAVVLTFGPETTAPPTRWVALMAAVVISGLFARWLVLQVMAQATAESDSRQEVERATAELRKTGTAKRAFLARMSHELRTPLHVILGFADVLGDGLAGEVDDRQQRHIDAITDAGRDLLAHVDELLAVSRLEAGVIPLAITVVDLGDTITDAGALVRARAREAGVTVVVSKPTLPMPVEADALRMRQTMWNLLRNAVELTPRGGRVHVVATVDGEVAVVSVHLGGSELLDPAEVLQQFERESVHAGGDGIGLDLSRSLAEAHGGRLLATDAPDGADLRLELPLRQAQAAEFAPDHSEARFEIEAPRAFLVPGSTANRALMARVGRWFAAASGGLLATLALITPGPTDVRLAVAGVGALALLTALVLGGDLLTRVDGAGEALVAFGAIAITGATLAAGPFEDLPALAYGWDILAATALVTHRRVAVKIGLILGCFAIALAVDQPPGAFQRWVAVVLVVATNATLIDWISGRLRDVIAAALEARLTAEATLARALAVSAHRSGFLQNTSQELQQPARSMVEHATRLRDGLGSAYGPKQHEYAVDIVETAKQLLVLISDLLELAELEAGRLLTDRRRVTLHEVVSAVVDELAEEARRAGLDLHVDVPDGLPEIEVDPDHLRQALGNLVGNAIKFTGDGGRVDVMSHVSDALDSVLLSVRDTGIGILPNQCGEVFEAFHQGSRTIRPPDHGSAGLGLTVAKRLVEMDGGTISLESTPDIGSTFTVALPIPHTPPRDPVSA